MANVNSNSFTIIFAVISCVTASILLSGANQGLKERQSINVKIDMQRSVLLAAGLVEPGAPAEAISVWFNSESGAPAIQPKIIDQATGATASDVNVDDFTKKPEKFEGKSLVYECSKPGQESIILPIVGQGLWGPMKGYIALGADGNSVLGICFYDHKETPGLGAEITEKWYTDQFKSDSNKKLLKTPGDYSIESFVGLTSLKGITTADLPEEKRPYHIDGISGATITSVGVTDVLTKTLHKHYSAYLKNRKS